MLSTNTEAYNRIKIKKLVWLPLGIRNFKQREVVQDISGYHYRLYITTTFKKYFQILQNIFKYFK